MRGDRRKPKARGGAEAGPWAGQSSTDSGGNANFPQDQKTKEQIRSAQTPAPLCGVRSPHASGPTHTSSSYPLAYGVTVAGAVGPRAGRVVARHCAVSIVAHDHLEPPSRTFLGTQVRKVVLGVQGA